MSFTLKKIVTQLTLLSFLMLALLSFSVMTSGADGRMQGDCPFSAMGTSLCPQGALPGAIHHILGAQAFFNVPINSSITELVIAFMTAVLAIIFFIHPILFRQLAYVSYHSPPFTSQDRKIKRWLSLHENSPSD